MTYDDPCTALGSGLPIEGAGACVSIDCMPRCESAPGGTWEWRNSCGGTLICEANCEGCTAHCQTLGWYAFCADDWLNPGGCDGLPTIELGLCGP